MNGVEDIVVQYIVNYGLAGVVIWIFYKLISNDLQELKDEIKQLREAIEKLSEKIASIR